MVSMRPPEWICGKRSSMSASMRAMSRRFVMGPCVGMPGASNFCHLAALANLPIFPPRLAETVTRGRPPMQQMFRLMVAALVAVAFTYFSGAAMAQGSVKQIPLTAKHIEGFIAAQKDMASVAE